MTKLLIELEAGKPKVKYKCRLLGLLTALEFETICRKPTFLTRMSTVATKRIEDICDEDLKDRRLAMYVKEKDGKNVSARTLLISEPLDYASQVEKLDNGYLKIHLSCKSGDTLHIEEVIT